MRLLVCGSRTWDDYALVKNEIREFILNVDQIECIIEGGAKGADYCAKLVAIELNIPFEEFPADWERYGKRAGPIRNQLMIDVGKPDYVLAFHDTYVTSRGTKSMINKAEKAGIPFCIISHELSWKPQGTIHPATLLAPGIRQYPPTNPAPYIPWGENSVFKT